MIRPRSTLDVAIVFGAPLVSAFALRSGRAAFLGESSSDGR